MLALFGVQLGVGVANVWWLAPVAIQLVHLLLSDLIWILLVLLAAERLAVPSTLGAAAKFSMRSAAAELRGR
jgi:heme A synthase